MKRFLPLVLSVCLLGCTSLIGSNISVFHDLPSKVSGIRYATIPLKDQEGSLEHKAYDRRIKDELNRRGFVESTVENATVVVFFQYGIDYGREMVASYPIIGQTGTSSTYTRGTITSYGGGSATYSATTYSKPIYGVVGTDVTSHTVYTRFFQLDILDKAALASGQVMKVYEAKVMSVGSSGQLAAVLPTLIKALFEDFPGKSGSTRRVTRFRDS
jgi:hypothetical protein